MAVKIIHNGVEISTGMKHLGRAQKKALSRSMNRVSTTIRKEVTQEIRRDYFIKSAHLKRAIRIIKSTAKRLWVDMVASGKRLSLTKFRARQLKKSGVRVTVRKGRPQLFKSAFIATMASGHRGVFKRIGEPQPRKRVFKGKTGPVSPRLPIGELTGPSVPQLLSSEHSRRTIEKVLKERLPIEYQRELDFEMSKVKKG